MRVSDVVEFQTYIEYRFADGIYPHFAGEVLKTVYDQTQLVEFKMLARALHDIHLKEDRSAYFKWTFVTNGYDCANRFLCASEVVCMRQLRVILREMNNCSHTQ